ncbi:MAG: hypothetical protein JAZ11_09925 [Candidatus Thiodiazotropha lotti]|nr:hypothetical protein [Candidatus Thiodiazotropha lotti]
MSENIQTFENGLIINHDEMNIYQLSRNLKSLTVELNTGIIMELSKIRDLIVKDIGKDINTGSVVNAALFLSFTIPKEHATESTEELEMELFERTYTRLEKLQAQIASWSGLEVPMGHLISGLLTGKYTLPAAYSAPLQ